MGVQHIVGGLPATAHFSFGYTSVMGSERPIHTMTLCTNQQDVAYATGLQNHLPRAIRDACGIQEQDQLPKWWREADERGVVCVH
ncbi:hypothetical protein PENSPDRAFT_652512 [Peniophora sp. CONT]|nr:hypothetical protein PENSPDRAFT_652512 [Peniophora sp. CONT]